MKTSIKRQTPEGFSKRRFEVFMLWAMQWNKEDIGRQLNISPGTADQEIRHIYDFLNVHSRNAAVQKAWLEGIFQKEDFEGVEWGRCH